MTVNEPVTITIDKAEALVLFDLLADFRDAPALPILMMLNARHCGPWKKILVDPFMDDYGKTLVEARAEVVAKWGSYSRDPDGESNS